MRYFISAQSRPAQNHLILERFPLVRQLLPDPSRYVNYVLRTLDFSQAYQHYREDRIINSGVRLFLCPPPESYFPCLAVLLPAVKISGMTLWQRASEELTQVSMHTGKPLQTLALIRHFFPQSGRVLIDIVHQPDLMDALIQSLQLSPNTEAKEAA